MLDEFRSTSITWDKATRRIYSPITANASDSNGRKLNIQVVNSGQIENLTGATLHLYWETKDKAHDGLDAFDASDISKGEFELFYTTGMLSNVGELNATLVLVDSTGKVVSDWFKITVTRGINEGAIESENSFSSLTQALIDVSNLEQNYAPRLNDLTAQLQQTMTQEEFDGWVGTILDGGPSIFFDTLTALQTAYPDGSAGVALVRETDPAKIYVWNGTAWQDFGPYQGLTLKADSVMTENIANEQVTFSKRTKLGHNAILSTRTGYKLPNYNTLTHTLEIEQLIIVVGKNRYVVSGVNLNCTTILNTFSSVLIAFSATKNEMRVIREDQGASLTEDYLYIGSINYSNAIADGGKFRQMNIPIPHTVDNLPSEGFSNRLIPIQLSNRPPNYKSIEQLMEFPDNVNLLIKNERYLINSGTNVDCSTILKNHPQGAKSVALIVYNVLTKQLRPVFSVNITELSKSDVVVATIAYDNINAEELVDVQMLCRFTIDNKSYQDFFKEEAVEEIVNVPSSFVNDYYKPISVQACDGTGGDGLSEDSTAQDTYDLYDKFVTDHPLYVKRVTSGNDSTDTLPIYSYEFQMPDVDNQLVEVKPTVIIVSGTHGNKVGVGDNQTSIFSLYYFMKDLTENWRGNIFLTQLRSQFKVVVIPVVNPWGVNNRQRVNGRGVDLNRNYGPNWVATAEGDYYSGTGPFSEKESQYVKRIIDENPNALFFSDFHTRGGNVAENQMMLMLLTNNTPSSTHRLAKQILEMCSMSFKSQFDYLNEDVWQGFIRREALAYSTSYAESKGIKSVLVETFPSVSGNSNMTTNNLDVMKMSTEEIGNAVNFAIQSYY